jgi:tRNA modification GTPase
MDLLALDLRESWQVLGEITGAVWHENLLDTIFSSFCLGK